MAKRHCPMCLNNMAGAGSWYDDSGIVEWTIECPICGFYEHWAYGNYVKFKEPKKRKYKRKFKKYVEEALKE